MTTQAAAAFLLLIASAYAEFAFAAAQQGAMNFSVVAREQNTTSFGKPDPFDFVAADVDRDGDTDLVVNWHLEDLELYLNSKHQNFTRLTREQSGFYHEGNVVLYAMKDDVVAVAKSTPGIYLWHDPITFGEWHIYISPAEDTAASVAFTVRSNEIIEKFLGVEDREIERNVALQTREDAWASFNVDLTKQPRHIHFKTRNIGSNIVVNTSSSLPIFLGKTFVKASAKEASLRMPDPHAMAWVNAMSSEYPDLFVVRGGNRGRMLPPFRAKRNMLFVASGKDDRIFNLESDPLVPTDYGRGRSVSWVDIDGDRQNELYIGNKASSNALLVLDPDSGQFQDLASKYGLALHCGDAFTWIDLDDDSYDDLLFMTCFGSIAIARNHQGKQFSIENAEDYGIVLGRIETQEELFEWTAINSFDFDADGDLDVVVSSLGKTQFLKVFRNTDGKFLDVTDAIGLGGVSAKVSVATDIDQDGYLDLVTAGTTGLHIYNNSAGENFHASRPVVQGGESQTPELSAIAVADFSGDGKKDIVAGSKGFWWILKNDITPIGKTFQVVMQGARGYEPVGTVVRAHYKSGNVLSQRYGSADTNGLSQFVFPLTFSVSVNDAIEYFTSRSPGSGKWEKIELADKRVVSVSH
jgi:hypothetical protein